MLPHETEVQAEIARKYRAQRDAMTALHDAVMSMMTAGAWTISRGRGLSRFVAETMIGLLTKGCRVFRAVQILSEHGLHDEANALVRVLMETTVAAVFILQRSSKKRALMFHAYGAAQSLKMINEWKKTKGLKRKATKAAQKQAADTVAFYSKELPGVDFARHWSGKRNLQEAMKGLRGDVMYATLYRFTSSISHGSDFGAQFELDATGNFVWQIEPTVEGFESPTYTARQLLWMLASRIDARLGLGFSAMLAPHKLTKAEVEAGRR